MIVYYYLLLFFNNIIQFGRKSQVVIWFLCQKCLYRSKATFSVRLLQAFCSGQNPLEMSADMRGAHTPQFIDPIPVEAR